MKKLGEICQIAGGAAFPIEHQGRTEGVVPLFKVSDMNSPGNESLLLNAANYIDRETATLVGARVWPTGTVVFPKVGGALLTNKKRVLGVPGAFDNNVMGLVPDEQLVNPKWLRLWFGQVDLAKLANTQALPSIRQSDVAAIPVHLPDISEQLIQVERIESQLRLATMAVVAGREQLLATGRLLRAVLISSFGSTPPIYSGSKDAANYKSLRSMARLESGHTPSRRHPEWWGGDVPWLALPDIRKLHGLVAYETIEHTNDLGIANSSARVLPVGTVCLCRDASIGFVTILGRPMATSQHFCNWVCDPEWLDAEFLMYAFMASFDYLRELGSGSVLKTIYMPAIESFHLRAPPLEEQRRIARQLRDHLVHARQLSASLAERQALVERLPQRILADAFCAAA